MGRRVLIKNVRAVALLAVVLTAVPTAALHFDFPRRSVGGDLQLSGVARLGSSNLTFFDDDPDDFLI